MLVKIIIANLAGDVEMHTIEEIEEQQPQTVALLTFDDVLSMHVDMPAEWLKKMVSVSGTRILSFFEPQCLKLPNSDNRYTTESVREVLLFEDMTFQVNILKRPVHVAQFAEVAEIGERVNCIEQLQNALFIIGSFNVCQGATGMQTMHNETIVDYSAALQDVSGTWRHKECPLLLPHENVCPFCAKMKKAVNRKRRRIETRGFQTKRVRVSMPSHRQISLLRNRMYRAQKTSKRLEHRLRSLKEELTQCQNNLSKASIEKVDEMFKKITSQIIKEMLLMKSWRLLNMPMRKDADIRSNGYCCAC